MPSLNEQLDYIYNFIKVPAPPEIRGVISYKEVRELYAGIFPNQTDRIHISDSQFEITAISEIRRFIDWSKVDRLKYVAEKLDCDDFAMALAGEFARSPGWSGFPVTFIWGDLYGGHAFTTAVAWKSFEDKTPTAYFLEPQTDWEIVQEAVEGMDLWLLPMGKR